MSQSVKETIRSVPGFPKAGIVFRDITTLLKNPRAFGETVDWLRGVCRERPVDLVCGIESRGFIFGGALARELGCGFVPIRKAGKLPAATIRESYALEYGTAEVEIHVDAVTAGKQVLVVDDLLATGGTLAAACRLVERLGGSVSGIAVIIELSFLNGRKKLSGYAVHSLVTYETE